jgi:hypothetical protein
MATLNLWYTLAGELGIWVWDCRDLLTQKEVVCRLTIGRRVSCLRVL